MQLSNVTYELPAKKSLQNSLQNCSVKKSLKLEKALSKAFKKSSCLDSVPFLTDKQILDWTCMYILGMYKGENINW